MMSSRVRFSWFLIILCGMVLSGCATRSTIDSRKKERYGVYSQLSPEMRSLVDQGQIKIGMPMDAVYIAWGKPSQISGGESSQGNVTTWLYTGSYLQEYNYVGYRGYYGRHGYWAAPGMRTDYVSANYVSAEVIFQNGVVREWRTLPHPE